SFAVRQPRRRRASSRGGDRVMTESPPPLTMLLSRHTKRREVIALVGGAALACPPAAPAQHPAPAPRILFLHALAENDPEVQSRVEAFRQGLETLGWTEKRNIQIKHRFSSGDLTRIQTYTAELVSEAPDLIVAGSTPVIAALKQATRTIPI